MTVRNLPGDRTCHLRTYNQFPQRARIARVDTSKK